MNKPSGLAGVVAGTSKICLIDGVKQKLYYAGYDVNDLAKHSTFEETSYLLLNNKLPNKDELAEFIAKLKKYYSLSSETNELIQSIAKSNKNANVMDVLRTVISSFGFHNNSTDSVEQSIQLLAQTPVIVASFWRCQQDLDSRESNTDLSIAGNLLYLLNSKLPTEDEIRACDICLILHADHGFNASTFTARVIAGTLSDIYSCISGAIGALKGPLHGGANQKVKTMLSEIQSPDQAEIYVNNTLAAGDKIFGFGHRVYKTVEDPRALILREVSENLSNKEGNDKAWYTISVKVREIMLEIAEKKGKPIYPNVDFFSASVYTYLNISDNLFTPIFAISRMAGWCAHVIEQYTDNKLIRPSAEYTGEYNKTYIDMSAR